jgi:gamma-glutamylcyclotransferase
MDAHYDIVMKARDQAGQGMRRYFGYSTVLDRAAFEEWRGQHSYDFFSLPEGQLGEALELALVYDFPSRWWGGRVAGLTNSAGASVWGRVFEIAEKDWPIIQHKEGVVTGMCVERAVQVRTSSGELIDATAFTTNPVRASGDGPVSPRFLEALVRGATAAALPQPWIDALRTSAK